MALGLAGATLVGFALRRWPWGRLGLDQFDEGIYCLAAAWLAGTGAVGPDLIPYAPPGYPILVAAGAALTGGEPPGHLVSAVSGTATIAVAGLVARAIFGNVGGLVAAWSICLAGPQIAFSRMALTDATFLLAWLLGIAAAIAFIRRPSWVTGLVMGASVGIAQQVKYNGWLLGAAVLLSSILGLARPEERRTAHTARVFGFGLVGAGGAALIVLPWYLFVEAHGGYAALLQHQRSYLDSPLLWWSNLQSQASQAALLSTPWSLVGIGGLALAVLLCALDPAAFRAGKPGFQALAALGVALVLLTCPIPIGLVLLAPLLRSADPARRLIAVTWLLLGVLTPFYHPYARLWLPFEGMHWLLLGGWVATVGFRGRDGETGLAPTPRWPQWVGLGVLVGGLGLVGQLPILGHPGKGGPDLFGPSNGLGLLARTVVERLPRPNPRLLTLVRPSLSYSLLGKVSVAGQGGIDQIRLGGDRTAWVLIDSAVLGTGLPRSGPGSLTDQLSGWDLAEEFTAPVTLPTALDLDPRGGLTPRPDIARFWLFRPRSWDNPR